MSNYSKPDHWALKAQKEGYPARSVYKLVEMDGKFGLIKPGRPLKVLDLGAAPGSWSLYILRKFSRSASSLLSLVSVDLIPLSRQYDQGLFDEQTLTIVRENFSPGPEDSLPEFHFIQGDFTLPEIREAILSRGPYNLVISDAAPATTGNRSVDTLRSLELAEIVLDYAQNALVPEGNLVAKVFQGADTGNLLKTIRTLFKTAKGFKPQACRAESFETYYLGLGKK